MVQPHVIGPFNKAIADAAELSFNADNAEVQVAVEWNYKNLDKRLSTNDFNRLLTV